MVSKSDELPAGAAGDLAAFRSEMIGKRITDVRYMTVNEAEGSGLMSRPVFIIFDNGAWIAPMADDECNDAGALAVGGVKALRFGLLGVV